ncbi:MAG: outer membrane protein assembly factor BamA [Proteobacteria bacterium]|nr:outer membrane protein assembly factor BamA [Pseudomonadota bacterium]
MGVAAFWLAIAGLSVPAAAQTGPGGAPTTVREIRVEGIQRIEPETVRSYMSIRAGDPFDPERIDRSLKSLFGTGLFADVSIRQEGAVLIVRVVENPIINRLVFEGNDQIDDETLNSEVQLAPRQVYSRTRVQNDVKRIVELYRADGRFAAKVEPKIIRLSQNRLDLVFEIDEGPPTKIRKISFIGNKRFTDSRLRSVIQSQESSLMNYLTLSFLTGAGIYDPDLLTFDRELLLRFYQNKGFADFRVVSAVAELSRNRRDFFVTFTLEEGPRYRFGSIEISSRLEELDVSKLTPAMKIKQGERYNAKLVEATVSSLTDAVGNFGFAFVDIKTRVKRDREKRTVGITFEIGEAPRVFVERIDVKGNFRTFDRVLRREFRLVEGDAFNTARFRRSRQRLRNLRFFKKVEVKKTEGSADDRVVIDVKVEEQSTGTFSIGGGFSSTEGLISQLSLTERNLLGKGQQGRLSFRIGTEVQEFLLGFTEPYFLDRNLSAGFDIFQTFRRKRDSINFEEQNTGLRLNSGFEYDENLRQGLSYNLRSTKITDIDDDASVFVKQQKGTTVTSSIGQSLTYDRRDSRVLPREGHVVRLTNEFAGLGGDARFIKTVIAGAQYYPVGEKWVASLRGKVGYIFGIGEDVRINDRFFLGGDSFPGFKRFGVGPRDVSTKDALGGNLLYTLTSELSFPLGGKDFEFRGYLFSLAGGLGNLDDSGIGIADSGGLRVSVGVGLGITTPFGPLRLDFANAIVKADFDETESFRFSVGTRF